MVVLFYGIKTMHATLLFNLPVYPFVKHGFLIAYLHEATLTDVFNRRQRFSDGGVDDLAG